MIIAFEKWHGCLNDFIIIHQNDDPIIRQSLYKKAPELCRRDGSGIGADGVIIIDTSGPQHETPRKLTIINSDGSEAVTCGNGIRCAARSLRHQHLQESTTPLHGVEFTLSDQRSIFCRFVGNDSKAPSLPSPFVSVDMGPAALNQKSGFHPQTKQALDALDITCDDWATCDIGNQHIVVFTETANPLSIHHIGPKLQSSPHWDGINVHIAKARPLDSDEVAQGKRDIDGETSERYHIAIWERGAGPTQSCGSGACAVACAVFEQGMTPRDSWVAVDTPGGRLYVNQPSPEDNVILAGPAQMVFQGTFEL